MNRFLLAIGLLVASLTSVGQDWPWNPDIDNDGFISTTDLLAILTVYNTEFQAQMLYTDTSSAVIWVGEEDYWNCASKCTQLEGNWKILDDKLVGGYKTELNGWLGEDPAWLDARVFGIQWESGDGQLQAPRLNGGSWTVQVSGFADLAQCVCQTRVAPSISAPGIDCAYIDLCGICEGPGPVYECGCEELPDYFCDCQGNQLDALGICGGGCLGDYDGDGICDEYVNGACGDIDFVSYHGYNYEVVEIGDRCWFKEDLRTPIYANGDSIITALSNSDWESAGEAYNGAWSVHPSYEYNGNVYNWYAVIDERGICPSGWDVPTRVEYENLLDTAAVIAGLSGTGPYLGEVTKALLDDDVTSNGTNESGFSATYTSHRSGSGSYYLNTDEFLGWTRSYSATPESWYLKIDNSNATNNSNYISVPYNNYLNDYPRSWGMAVRCVKLN